MKTQNLNSSRINFFSLLAILLILTVFMTMGAQAQAATWHSANQVVVAWDAVTKLQNGDNVPDNHAVQYEVYLSPKDNGKQNPTSVWIGFETVSTVTHTVEGNFWVGVKSIRLDENQDMINESVISWSDDANAVEGGAGHEFGLAYWVPVMQPTGLRPEPTAFNNHPGGRYGITRGDRNHLLGIS